MDEDEVSTGGGGTLSVMASAPRTTRTSDRWTGADDGHATELRRNPPTCCAANTTFRGDPLSIGEDGDEDGDPPLLRTSSDDDVVEDDISVVEYDRDDRSGGGSTVPPVVLTGMPCCCCCCCCC